MIDVWDSLMRADSLIQEINAIQQLRDDARKVLQNRCGNCYFWMKSSLCPREHNVKGYSRGPSSGDIGCNKFQITEHSKKLGEERIAESNSRQRALDRQRTPREKDGE